MRILSEVSIKNLVLFIWHICRGVIINYRKVSLDGKEIYVHFIGDLHIGHECCDMDFIIEQLKMIPINPQHRIILMGDLLDIGIKSAIGGSVYDNKLKMNDQYKLLLKLLKPRSQQIDAAVPGNHEWRLYKECGIDLYDIMADTLQIPYMKFSGLITYAFNKRAYNINFFHGKGGGSVEGSLKTCKRMSEKTFADIYAMGHCHHSAHTKRQFKIADPYNKKLTELTQYFMLTGSALKYDESYAEQSNLEIVTPAMPFAILRGDTEKKCIQIVS